MKIALMTSGTINSSLSYRPFAFAKELHKKGHDVYIFALRFDKYSKFKDEKITEIDGVKIIRPLQIRSSLFEIGLIPYIISSAFLILKLNPDIIHVYKPTPVILGSLLPHFIRKTPIVLDTDDMDSEVMKTEKNSKLRIILVKISEKILAYKTNTIITASKYLYDFYSNKYNNKLIVHISNGADFTSTHKLNSKKIFNNKIVFVGNINRTNILEPLFFAIKEIKKQGIKAHAVVIGNGKYLNYFKKLTYKLKITKNVSFLGWIPQNNLYKYIHIGDLGYCYMPNELTIKACSSMKVFQYMQYGAVPLVSNVGDLPSYTFNGKAGYIAKHSNIKSLTETIIKAISNKSERKTKINFAIKNAGNKYKWKVLATKVEKIYKKML